jgi:hypothetical protein
MHGLHVTTDRAWRFEYRPLRVQAASSTGRFEYRPLREWIAAVKTAYIECRSPWKSAVSNLSTAGRAIKLHNGEGFYTLGGKQEKRAS